MEKKEGEKIMEDIEKKEKRSSIEVKHSKKSLRDFSSKHILRSKVTSILLVVLAGIFIFSLLWMNYLTIKNEDLIEMAYRNHIITADIVLKENAVRKQGTGAIDHSHIENLENIGFIKDYKAVVLMIYEELYRNRDGEVEKYEVGEKDKVHFYTYEPSFRVEASNKPYNSDEGIMRFSNLKFIEGYSLGDFEKEYSVDYTNPRNLRVLDEKGEEFFPVLVSSKAMDHFDLELGDKILLKNSSNYLRLIMEAYGTIVGTFDKVDRGKDRYGFSLENEKELFIYPISVLKAVEHKLYYNKLEFLFNPEKNRELVERKEEIRRIVSTNPYNEVGTDLNFWDGELTNVVGPLEKNISLWEILYPVTFILSIIIAGILGFMMVLRRSTDVAILRILGVKEKEVRWNLFRENMVLVLIGIVVSTAVIIGITRNSYAIGVMKYVMVIGGYLLGTIAGLILGIGKVTNKKPLELLQVKE